MARQSQAWKALERLTASELKGRRVLRGADFAKSDVDVIIDEFGFLKADCKYRQKWAHHKFLEEIVEKYCTSKGDMPVLITKTPKQIGACVTIRLDHFGVLLDMLRVKRR